jgi:coenzyme F420 biosynthesis associated uncharacterized protein
MTTHDARTAGTSDAPGGRAGRDYVDWDFAAKTARRIVPAGPKASQEEIRDLVAELRQAASRAVEPVAQTSGLRAPVGAPRPLVVDRPRWIETNVASLQGMLGPVLDEVVERHRRVDRERGRAAGKDAPVALQKVGGALTGTEVAGMLSWVSTKVLGQYDLAPQGTPRLLLVAPNIMSAERELEVDEHDFRLWVCLHEETHRVQFTAVPWLRDHIVQAARSLGSRLVPEGDALGQQLQTVVTGLPGVLRGETDITQLLATPEQREQIAAITAVMSLLEGHADVVMDEVGPEVIPTVALIRERFTQRRKGAGAVDVLLRRLLGMEAKMRQYRDGAVFVRAVIDEVGLDGFNRVWSSPETLPRAVEIPDPGAWVRRVHG